MVDLVLESKYLTESLQFVMKNVPTDLQVGDGIRLKVFPTKEIVILTGRLWDGPNLILFCEASPELLAKILRDDVIRSYFTSGEISWE